jgi:outer membrane protein, heavy metal efflux system
MFRIYSLTVISLLFALLFGCSERKAKHAFVDVQSKVQSLSGHRIEWNEESGSSSSIIEHLLQKEISLEIAVQIALLKNASLQATLEDLGIAEADVIEAGLLKNPMFDGQARFPSKSGLLTNTEFGITLSFIDLILTPMRGKLEAMRFDVVKNRVSYAVLNHVADVRVAYYQLQGEQAKQIHRKNVLLATEAASEYVQKLLTTGNAAEVELLPRIAQYHQAKLESGQAALRVVGLEEKLARLMGIPAPKIRGKIPSRLPDLPPSDDFGSIDALEEQAIAERLDLEMRRQDLSIIDKARSLRHWGVFTEVQAGASTERGPEPVRVTGPTLQMEFPIFNRGQADRKRFSSQARQSRAKLEALELAVRSEVREALSNLMIARSAVEEYQTSIEPLRTRIVDLAQQRYNAMTMSALDLLAAKQEQLNAQIEKVSAQSEYWTRRVELERVLGGRLPAPAAKTEKATETPTEEKPAISPPAAKDEQQHHH